MTDVSSSRTITGRAAGGGGGGGGGVFTDSGTIIYPDSLYDRSFIVGSPQMNDSGNAAHDARMFFDKANVAFRAGSVEGTEWDTRGSGSVAIGRKTIASATDTTVVGYRGSATASWAAALGGDGNVASAQWATAVGGYEAIASGNYSVAMGYSAESAGNNSIAIGNLAYAAQEGSIAIGKGTTASSAYGICLGRYSDVTANGGFAAGFRCNAAGEYSSALGVNSKPTLRGQLTRASNAVNTGTGNPQESWVDLANATTNATTTRLVLGVSGRLVVPLNTAWAFTGKLVGKQTGGTGGVVGATGYWTTEGVIKNVAGTVSWVETTPTWTAVARDTEVSTNWTTAPAISLDTTFDALQVDVTGAADRNIRWIAAFHLVEVGST